MRVTTLLLAAAAAVIAVSAAMPAHAGRSYDNCTGTIGALPAIIGSQGTWCLKQNLATAIVSGAAITINANNVTIDCNDFKVGGLAAGIGTVAVGLQATDRLNTTIRNCDVRGFMAGIRLAGDAAFGGVVEDNRVDGSTVFGIDVAGGGHLVRRNHIVDTGGRPGATQVQGIRVTADQSSITENTVVGMTATAPGAIVSGIGALGEAIDVGNNFITGQVLPPEGAVMGVTAYGVAIAVHGNRMLGAFESSAFGVSSLGNLCADNLVIGYPSNLGSCTDVGGNGHE